jgi:hypothetical protein
LRVPFWSEVGPVAVFGGSTFGSGALGGGEDCTGGGTGFGATLGIDSSRDLLKSSRALAALPILSLSFSVLSLFTVAQMGFSWGLFGVSTFFGSLDPRLLRKLSVSTRGFSTRG